MIVSSVDFSFAMKPAFFALIKLFVIIDTCILGLIPYLFCMAFSLVLFA